MQVPTLTSMDWRPSENVIWERALRITCNLFSITTNNSSKTNKSLKRQCLWHFWTDQTQEQPEKKNVYVIKIQWNAKRQIKIKENVESKYGAEFQLRDRKQWIHISVQNRFGCLEYRKMVKEKMRW